MKMCEKFIATLSARRFVVSERCIDNTDHYNYNYFVLVYPRQGVLVSKVRKGGAPGGCTPLQRVVRKIWRYDGIEQTYSLHRLRSIRTWHREHRSSCSYRCNRRKEKEAMKRPLNTTQSVVLTLLWIAVCYLILVGSKRIDGPLILTLIISGALVFIPIIKSVKNKKR